ncbi:MAG: YfcC family protein [Lachnospiraceae bacterium]|nr:YfcC family protein [Lachnospiraceae bacterium]
MSNGPKIGEKKKFKVPHVFIILFLIIVLCTILTWIVPAGAFDYVENDQGRSVAVAGTWHEVDPTPVGPLRMFELIYEGMVNAADIAFLVFITFASVTFVIKSGAFDGAVAILLKIFKGKSSLITIPIFMALVGLGSSTIGMFEEWLPFIPVFAAVYTGMGYDALVGLAVVAFGAGIGYSGAMMNPFTVGVAQGIAEVTYMSGSGFRIMCHAVMLVVGAAFIMRYASKVKDDEKNSYLYGTVVQDLTTSENAADVENLKFGIQQKLVLLDLVAAIAVVVTGVIKAGWYFSQICAVFIIMAIIAAIIMRWNLNKIGEMFAAGFTEATTAAMMVGIARGVKMVLTEGGIIDTVVNALTVPLSHLPAALSGIAMLIMQTILNFFIPSGSGQAAVSMPIMAPMADLLGLSRDVAVLAYQFGDGLSNIIWPTAYAAVVAGLAGVPLDKWWKLAFKLFGILIVVQAILMVVAVATGFGA